MNISKQPWLSHFLRRSVGGLVIDSKNYFIVCALICAFKVTEKKRNFREMNC